MSEENRKILSRKEIIDFFNKEFEPVANKFTISQVKMTEAYDSSDEQLNSAGVYVHWHPQYGVIKVGKSQSNSKSRAFEHLETPTKTDKYNMASLKNDTDAWLLLFNVKSINDLHWVLSLEAYFDTPKTLDPLILSSRRG